MLNAAEGIAGHCLLSIDGSDMGFTTKDGFKFHDEHNIVAFEGDQTLIIPKYHRAGVKSVWSCSLMQQTQEQQRIHNDFENAASAGVMAGQWTATPTEWIIVLTAPADNGGTCTYEATAVIMEVGEVVKSGQGWSSQPIVLGLVGDPITNKNYDMTRSAASTDVPVVGSYATVTAVAIDAESALADEDTGINVAHFFQFNFNVNIRPDMLTGSRFILKDVTGDVQVAADVVYRTSVAGVTDYTKVIIKPTSALSAATTYELIAVGGIKSTNGQETASLVSIQFDTA